MPDATPGEITLLLRRWEQGEPGSFDQLAPLVYDQLRDIAEAYVRGEREGHTLQATAVANEVFVDLLRLKRVSLRDRSHFFAFAAKLARRILVDSARRASAVKRGFGFKRVPLDAELGWLGGPSASRDGEGTLDLATALDELADLDATKARAIELRYFLGCTVEETADLLETPKRSVERGLEFSLAWLRQRLASTTVE
ncbi:MAG: sigma-70 family RNA polymerase sigma factor [Acidobacteriaceae bacterium]|nr:sigma-70 family RNA polymerase sigma factor [Acidobacteriaceae bacterium]